MAQIIMVFGKLEIPYGTYRFSTDAEKNRVNELAIKIGEERECQPFVREP